MSNFYTGHLTPAKMFEKIIDEKINNLATVATSGDYNDLTNKPTIHTVPANISAFTNDMGYLTQHQDISGKQDTLTAGENITIQNNVISSGSDPNKIPNGTIIEGKFSELPQFFESLENKYCNGIVTYKITQDETIIDGTVLYIPNFKGDIIIDGNEKIIDWQPDEADFLLTISDGTNVNTLLNNKLYLQNLNISSTSTTIKTEGIKKDSVQCEFYISNCTFTNLNGQNIHLLHGKTFISNCEISSSISAVDSSWLSKSAIHAVGETLTVSYCVCEGLTRAFIIREGTVSVFRSISWTNCTSKLWCGSGSLATVASTMSAQQFAVSDQDLNKGVIYKNS